MNLELRAGAVVYAKDLSAVAAFYAEVADLSVASADDGYVVLESSYVQLVVVAMPARIAATIEIAVPPVRREDTAVKLVFPVPSIAAARAAAVRRGGAVDPAEREWTLKGSVRCDGNDPEGNVIQLTQPVS